MKLSKTPEIKDYKEKLKVTGIKKMLQSENYLNLENIVRRYRKW